MTKTKVYIICNTFDFNFPFSLLWHIFVGDDDSDGGGGGGGGSAAAADDDC